MQKNNMDTDMNMDMQILTEQALCIKKVIKLKTTELVLSHKPNHVVKEKVHGLGDYRQSYDMPK